MTSQIVLFLIASTPLRRYCSHKHCGCGDFVHAQRDILHHLDAVASVHEMLDAGRLFVSERIAHLDTLLLPRQRRDDRVDSLAYLHESLRRPGGVN